MEDKDFESRYGSLKALVALLAFTYRHGFQSPPAPSPLPRPGKCGQLSLSVLPLNVKKACAGVL